jgi:peroxiredoxin
MPVSHAKTLFLIASLSLFPAIALHAEDQKSPAQEKTMPAATAPKVGDKAKDFTLKTLDEKEVQLSRLTKEGPVVVVVLRGWPGYQCPICTKQVADLMSKADDFAAAKARVVLIYPGPADRLGEHAREFAMGKNFKADFSFVTDPGFSFTNAYHLRWDAPKETAYPSTFIVGTDGVIKFAKVSTGHGDRSSAAELLKALDSK